MKLYTELRVITLMTIIQDGGGSRCTMSELEPNVLGAMKELQGDIEEPKEGDWQ